jgi:hypothetical protein
MFENQGILALLLGDWDGDGRGDFPTVDPFRYREHLSFTPHATAPHVHYEQRTWLVSNGDDDGDPSHWESGFLMAQEDGSFHLANAQQSGRVEVLVGEVSPGEDGGFELRLESVVHAHDPRVISTSRVLRVRGDELRYECEMATDQVAARTLHLECRLSRRAGDAGGVDSP